VPRLEVRDLGPADAQKDPQDFQISYILGERGIQAAAALFDERKVEARSVGNSLQGVRNAAVADLEAGRHR
jgi:hypothetical protein